jgi:hypothetical protein
MLLRGRRRCGRGIGATGARVGRPAVPVMTPRIADIERYSITSSAAGRTARAMYVGRLRDLKVDPHLKVGTSNWDVVEKPLTLF